MTTAWILASTTLAGASPQSQDLIAKGVADLSNQAYAQALEKFDAAARADPDDAEALFFQGVALNRLGRYAEAITPLEKARAAGLDHPDLAFETGWSLLGLHRWKEAAAELERYEQTHPGRGQTSEFLGRAYLGLREYDKAETKLEEAMRRDPALASTARLHLALVAEERKDSLAVRRHLEALLREEPGSPLTRALREQLEQAAGVAPSGEKPWHLAVSVGGGYNSNVASLGDEMPLPTDISSKHSAFTRFTLNASYDFRLTPQDTLTAGYGLLADIYGDVPSFDLADNLFSLDYRHNFSRDLVGALRVSDEYTLVSGKNFRNQVAVRPTVGYRFTDWLVTELAYTFATSKYYFPTTAVQNRDGNTHTISLTGYFGIPGTPLQPRLAYFHTWNDSVGSDFDYGTDGITVGLASPLVWGINADVSYTHTFDRYSNNNSLAGPAGYAFKRQDDLDSVTVQLGRPILPWLGVYARFDYLNERSDIAFFKFNQQVWSAGFVASF